MPMDKGFIEVTNVEGEPWRIEVSCEEEGKPFRGHPELVISNLNRIARSLHWVSLPGDFRLQLLHEASECLKQSGCEVVVHWPTTHLDQELKPDEVW